MTGAVISPHRARINRGAELAPAVVGAVALAAFLGSDDGIVLCPYRRCTGGDCPLCGTTRAAGHLLRGDLAASWQAHPIVLVLAMQIPMWLAVTRSTRRLSNSSGQTWWQRNGANVLLANIGVATAVWILRLALGDVAGPSTLTVPW